MASFILSFDCEGKWGMADQLEPYLQAHLTDQALVSVYDRLVTLLARYDVPATFAYVMAFTLTPDQRALFPQLAPGYGAGEDQWMAYHWADLAKGNNEGWFQPHALDAVKADGRHEIACHGFCHRPLSEALISEKAAQAEIEAAQAVAKLKGVTLRTMIFPRNMIGHLPVLRRSGFVGYRALLPRPGGRVGQIAKLAQEFNVWAKPQNGAAVKPGELVEIPAGYFFNWRFGMRRRVPQAVTVKRWSNLLEHTVRGGGVTHLWLHPHNLITGPDTCRSLEAVLARVARLRDAGKLTIETQEQYCLRMIAAA